jgi:formylglycine-generating enzyme required for sulfatase activity
MCEGGYAGIFNMSGSVWEYSDNCDGKTGSDDNCYSRGGAFNLSSSSLECASLNGDPRDHFADDIGFRCCLP